MERSGERREDEYHRRSENDKFSGAPGGGQDPGDEQQEKKKKRHTPEQIQELEAFFKENFNPDENQRKNLGIKLGLDEKSVNYWFQNRRTRLKVQLEHHENILLRQENEKLREENNIMKEAMTKASCKNCGGVIICHGN